MVRNIDDVKAELRKLTNTKPVHAVAGAGVLASQTLKELPWRLVQWTRENPPESLPGRANGYVQTARNNANGYVQTAQSRANGYVQTARTKASGGYDKLAEHGKKALNGQSSSTESRSTTQTRSTARSRSTAQTRSTARSRSTAQSPSTTAQGNRELNGKPKGKAPSSRTGTNS
jgi:hypothetical protein